MADTYFVRFRGRTVGPYSLAQAQHMARKGQLSRTSEVSSDGQSWSQAGSFSEIFARSSTTVSSTGGAASVPTDGDTSMRGAVTFPDSDIPELPIQSEWYYTSGGEQKGPTPASNIVTMIKAGTLDAQDRVWREGLNNWVSMTDVPEFNAAVATLLHLPDANKGISAEGGAFCRECGARINRKAVICTQCGVPQHSEGEELTSPILGSAQRAAKQTQSSGLITAGYVCAAISLLILPPVFGLVAFIIGIINLTRNQVGHGIAQIVLSFICGLMGFVIGAALMS